jgi:hypothetical protein
MLHRLFRQKAARFRREWRAPALHSRYVSVPGYQPEGLHSRGINPVNGSLRPQPPECSLKVFFICLAMGRDDEPCGLMYPVIRMGQFRVLNWGVEKRGVRWLGDFLSHRA